MTAVAAVAVAARAAARVRVVMVRRPGRVARTAADRRETR
jgi:hypothetical protein